MKPLIFAGTVEGRQLAEALSKRGIRPTVSVATPYGGSLLRGLDAEILCGRLDRPQMASLMRREGFTLVLDATHPYAAEVTATIRAACGETGLPYLRLRREGGGYAGCDEVPTAAQAADWLNRHAGRVLLTTGSKELEAFTAVEGFAERLFVRVLPLPGVVEKCAALGFPASRIIAMQGPFTEEFNRALLRQLGIELLVTKDTGDEGGFSQKLEAARACCARVLVIRRPDEPEGALAPDALWRLLEDRLQQEATQ